MATTTRTMTTELHEEIAFGHAIQQWLILKRRRRRRNNLASVFIVGHSATYMPLTKAITIVGLGGDSMRIGNETLKIILKNLEELNDLGKVILITVLILYHII
jgi:phosphohistidine phosphatase SixA